MIYFNINLDLLQLFRFANMDYSICQALAQVTSVKRALVIYDIGCEWSRHFPERVLATETLSLREDLDVIAAVGKFHLAGHVRECFALFSLNFVQGAGQLDGEILETLWASLDKVAGQTRGMSQAHRQEVLDDFMNDSNWKKLIRSGDLQSFNYLPSQKTDLCFSFGKKKKSSIDHKEVEEGPARKRRISFSSHRPYSTDE